MCVTPLHETIYGSPNIMGCFTPLHCINTVCTACNCSAPSRICLGTAFFSPETQLGGSLCYDASPYKRISSLLILGSTSLSRHDCIYLFAWLSPSCNSVDRNSLNHILTSAQMSFPQSSSDFPKKPSRPLPRHSVTLCLYLSEHHSHPVMILL